MGIVKLLKQVQIRYVRWTLRKLDFSKPQPVACLRLLQVLDPKAFRYYKAERLLKLSIALPVESLASYRQYLKELSIRLFKQVELPNSLLREGLQQYNVDQVISKADGYYVNIEVNLAEFKRAAEQLLKVYPIEPTDHGLNCHYQLRLNKTLLALVVVINTLLEAQLTQ